jgi:hypothetical protein
MRPNSRTAFSNCSFLGQALLYCVWILALSACSSEPQEPAPLLASQFRSLSFQEQIAFAKEYAGIDPSYELFGIRVIDMSMYAQSEYTLEYEFLNSETGKLGRLRLVKLKDRDELQTSFFDDYGQKLDASSIEFYLGNLGHLHTRKKEIAKIQINPLDLYDHYQKEQAAHLRAFSEGKTDQPVDFLSTIELELLDKDPTRSHHASKNDLRHFFQAYSRPKFALPLFCWYLHHRLKRFSFC